jgi:hypothetical protein
MKTAVITGVSSGIGKALAELLLRRGWKVFGSLRNADQGAELVEGSGGNFVPLIFDVCDEGAVEAAAARVRSDLAGRRLGVLVNNAGAVLAGPLALQPTEEFRRQLEINLVGPFLTVKAFLPLLGSDPAMSGTPGRIVNVSSMAGHMGVPFMGAYAASKHGVEGFSDSLRCEVAQYGIHVITVIPGSVATPVFAKAQQNANPYDRSDYQRSFDAFLENMKESVGAGHSPEHVAQGIFKAIESARPRYSYPIIWRKLLYWHLPRLIPKRALLATMCGRYGLPTGSGTRRRRAS